MPTLLRNLRYTVRMLWKNPGLTLTILCTLALGIGANTAIFTVDYATLLAPLPYPQPDQLVMVWSKIKTFRNGISAGDYTDWKRQNHSFQDLNATTGGSFNIASKDQPENIDGGLFTPGYFNMLGRPFFLGRDFLPRGRRGWQGPRSDPYPQALVAPGRRPQAGGPHHAHQRRALYRGRRSRSWHL